MFKVADVVEGLSLGYERLAAPGIVTEHHLGAVEGLLVSPAHEQALGQAGQDVHVAGIQHVGCQAVKSECEAVYTYYLPMDKFLEEAP